MFFKTIIEPRRTLTITHTGLHAPKTRELLTMEDLNPLEYVHSVEYRSGRRTTTTKRLRHSLHWPIIPPLFIQPSRKLVSCDHVYFIFS